MTKNILIHKSCTISVSILISSDPAVQALQYLDGIHSKDPKEKAQFFRTTLTEVFPLIPQVSFHIIGMICFNDILPYFSISKNTSCNSL